MGHALPSLAARDYSPSEDQVVRIRGTWADFKRILKMRGDRSLPRISFDGGVIELMSPSRHHENLKSLIGRLVEVWCLEHEVVFTTLGSWTLEDPSKKRGAEPDECYVFGDGRGGSERPDLAIEVDWTHGRIDKLDIYRKLGVRELWYWRSGVLQPYLLRRGRYVPVEQSEVLPGLDLAQLVSFLDRATTSGAVCEYREALRGATSKSKS
jgi:Uma2 family endonuclease